MQHGSQRHTISVNRGRYQNLDREAAAQQKCIQQCTSLLASASRPQALDNLAALISPKIDFKTSATSSAFYACS